MLSKKIPIYYIPIAVIAGVAIPLIVLRAVPKKDNLEIANIADANCSYNVKRMSGYQYIRPLLFAEQGSEAERFKPLEESINSKVQQLKTAGVLQSVSVYIRLFSKGEWMSYNEQESYNPGSLIKVPVLITILKMEEAQPGFLDRKITYTAPDGTVPHQTYNSLQIKPGKSYSIRELLRYMIVYSDNNATHLLNENMEVSTFKKTFTDLGLPDPDVTDRNFQIYPSNYALFIKALYNGSYISRDHSEYAMKLMSETNYKDGMIKGLPENTPIAHKFGEGGTREQKQLHESGIIYVGDKPYLLVIMTKGQDVSKLPGVIAELTRLVYESMKAIS